jgi:hypothetical protein
LPFIGYVGGYGFMIAAVILAVLAQGSSGRVGMPPPSHWSTISNRLIAGEVCAVLAWGLYKLGSQRIVLNGDTMRIITWGLIWTVVKDELADVALSPQVLTIVLADKSTIEPLMFYSSGPGMLYINAGLFRNSMSSESIKNKLLEWRDSPSGSGEIDRGIAQSLGRRSISKVRANLPFLLGLVAIVAIEAVVSGI